MTRDPVTLFFALGVVAGLLRSDLKVPGGLPETLSVFLLVAVRLKGGVEVRRAGKF